MLAPVSYFSRHWIYIFLTSEATQTVQIKSWSLDSFDKRNIISQQLRSWVNPGSLGVFPCHLLGVSLPVFWAHPVVLGTPPGTRASQQRTGTLRCQGSQLGLIQPSEHLSGLSQLLPWKHKASKEALPWTCPPDPKVSFLNCGSNQTHN